MIKTFLTAQKAVKPLLTAVSAVLPLLLLMSCSEFSDSDFYAGETVTPEQLESVAAMLRTEDTERYPRETDASGNTVVFWTAGGACRHLSRSCTSLSSSKELNSGSEAEAEAAGKDKLCTICGAE